MVWKWDIFSNINRDLVILFGDIEVSFGADLTLIDLVKKNNNTVFGGSEFWRFNN
jgi:hypothetical protein